MIYAGVLSAAQVLAPERFIPQPDTRFTFPNRVGPGPEAFLQPSGAAGPYVTYVGPAWRAEADCVITAVRVEVTAALASNTARLGLTEIGADDQPSRLVADFGTVDCTTTGFKDVVGVQVRVIAGRYYGSLLTRFGGGGSIVIRAHPVPYGHFGQDLSITNRVLIYRSVTDSQTSPTSQYPTVPSRWTTVASGTNNIAGPYEWMLQRREAVSR